MNERIEKLTQYAASKPHGTRSRYSSGCRCDECRASNTAYERDRVRRALRGDVNPLVDASLVRRHLEGLRSAGIGTRTIAEYSDVGRSAICQIVSGKKTSVRRKTAEALLAVDRRCVRGGNLVRSGATKRRLSWLLGSGFSKRALAVRLGYQSPAIQIAKKKTVTARTEAKVRRLHDMLRSGE